MDTRMMFARAVAGESVAEGADFGRNRLMVRPILWYNMRQTDRFGGKTIMLLNHKEALGERLLGGAAPVLRTEQTLGVQEDVP